MTTRKDEANEPERLKLSFEQTLAILAKVPKAEVDALEAERPKRKKRVAAPSGRRRKKPIVRGKG